MDAKYKCVLSIDSFYRDTETSKAPPYEETHRGEGEKMQLTQGTNDQFMALAGIRYCLGRMTYAADIGQEWLKEHWSQLNTNTQGTIVRDLVMALMDGEAGSPTIDAPRWREVAQWAWDTLSAEKRAWVSGAVAHKQKPWPL